MLRELVKRDYMWPPRSTAARVAAPRGGEFPLGRPGGELWPPCLARCAPLTMLCYIASHD